MLESSRPAVSASRRRRWAGGLSLLAAALTLMTMCLLPACQDPPAPVELPKGQVKLTLLHTSDIHSRLFPYDLQITAVDSKLGLGPNGVVARVGGAAQISHVLQRERARADRVLHLDGGDCFQGAPIFNFFNGEAELKVMTEMGTDAMIVANHEFDKGALNLGEQLQKWTDFPVLAANYKTDDPNFPGSTWLSRIFVPWTSFDLQGLKVGVIGLGNLTTLGSLFEQPNSLGLVPYNTEDIVQFYTDLIRPLVDVVVIVSHIGLEYDEQMIANTSGVDVVLGGHNHIVLQPPKQLSDCQLVDENGDHYIQILSGDPSDDPKKKYKRRRCNPRPVLLAHSGAFAKYVGRLDLTLSNTKEDIGDGYDPLDRHEVVASNYQIIPITEDVPEDTHVRNVLQPYRAGLDALIDLDLLVGYAPSGSSRSAPSGGDSALGNMVANAMWLRQGVQTDFAFTNSAGIRAAMVPGPVTIEQLFNIFPFDNSISVMTLSGTEVQAVMDFSARRAASRGCVSQIQIAGARVVLNCDGCNTANTDACTTDLDCGDGGTCGDDKRCKVTACAPYIYIGANADLKCRNDCFCSPKHVIDDQGNCSLPEGQETYTGSCDTSNVDANGLGRCFNRIDPLSSYQLATSNYLATGGSGFRTLRANTTQYDTLIQQRDALTEYIRRGRPCGYGKQGDPAPGVDSCQSDDDCKNSALACVQRPLQDDPNDKHCVFRESGQLPCSTDNDCGDPNAYACSCIGHVTSDASGQCQSVDSCNGQGKCVLRACRNSVAEFHRDTCRTARTAASQQACEASVNPCELGGEECKFLACVDERIGNFTDNRIQVVGK